MEQVVCVGPMNLLNSKLEFELLNSKLEFLPPKLLLGGITTMSQFDVSVKNNYYEPYRQMNIVTP